MHVLVTWGSKRGGTEGIAHIVAEALEDRGHEVTAVSAEAVDRVEGFDAVVVGGALYANRWPANVRRFVRRHVRALRRVPVWFFSSGPLDESADRRAIEAPTQVAVLAERVGAKGHVTFGGRLAPDAEGFPASAMAESNAGDWRNPPRIRAWANELADALPEATPGEPVEHPARSMPRLLAHGALGWAACTAVMMGLLQVASLGVALTVHAIAAPLVFVALAWHYFRARGAREPLSTATAFTAIVVVLDLVVVGGAIQQSLAMFASFAGTWLPFALIFGATWATGALMSTMPWEAPGEDEGSDQEPGGGADASASRASAPSA
ncbi:MAG TPA: flavodoxin domain-containing protein [Sandaracinaceae bacterium LLY-WYZ-13_1]|nr:flavodoxin domain-containing protein [Sandaracinaceae bacterium LLY-WYZ-13_1]